MAVVNLKSTQITNRDATPQVLNNPASGGGATGPFVREAFGMVAIGTSDTNASTYRFCSIPSNARISAVLAYTDAVPGGGAAAMDVGLYDVSGPLAVSAGAIIGDGDQFAAALDIHTAVLTAKDITYNSGEDSLLSASNQLLWQVLGLASDPNKLYDVVGTLTVSNSTAGFNMAIKVQYVI